MKDEIYEVNGINKYTEEELSSGTINKISNDTYIYQYANKNYKIKVYQKTDKSYTLKINGYSYTVKAITKLDQLIEKLGFNKSKSRVLTSISAPMPGMVLEVMVKVGQEIQQGDDLLILEAMKMENIIKADGNGTISSINIKVGDKVEKGQVMIEL